MRRFIAILGIVDHLDVSHIDDDIATAFRHIPYPWPVLLPLYEYKKNCGPNLRRDRSQVNISLGVWRSSRAPNHRVGGAKMAKI